MTDTTSTLEVVRRSAQVAEVWLNRPDVRNAFNQDVIAEHDRAQRGKAFCAGADLSWMKEMAAYTCLLYTSPSPRD